MSPVLWWLSRKQVVPVANKLLLGGLGLGFAVAASLALLLRPGSASFAVAWGLAILAAFFFEQALRRSSSTPGPAAASR